MPQEILDASVTKGPTNPLIFISHDSRDADLAESFSNLLRSVSAGMLKSFRSSDKKGTEGIEFGDEWYKRLMEKLVTASDVVCLLTERSLGRPWILYEAGVAKGKLETPVHGLAIGVPLSSVTGSGPFYQFQNSDDSEDSLKKLVSQLCRRVPGLEPDEGVIRTQVQEFKTKADVFVKTLKQPQKGGKEEVADVAGAKVLEEMKSVVRDLSVRLEQNIAAGSIRSRARRRLNPPMLFELAQLSSRRKADPIGILILAAPFKEDLPWIYDIASEIYRATTTGRDRTVQKLLRDFEAVVRATARGPVAEELLNDKESYRLLRELPDMMEFYIQDMLHRAPPTSEPNVALPGSEVTSSEQEG